MVTSFYARRKANAPHRFLSIAAALIAVVVGIFPIYAKAVSVTLDIDITYEGAYVPVEGHGISFYLPNDWLVFQAESPSIVFMAGNVDHSRLFWVEFFRHNGASLESIAQTLLESGRCANLLETSFRGISFLCYDQMDESVFVALTVSDDSKYLYIFSFSPQNDINFKTLATQIMASIQMAQK